jgi:ATP-dependent exoDNAse (exonuclease V) alpha subunit
MGADAVAPNALQQYAIDCAVDDHHSLFLTGPPGAGKSYVAREIVARARAAGRDTVVIAPTNSAALLIGGRTIHSFVGLRGGAVPAGKAVQEHVERMYYKKKQAIRAVRLLLIDEISMVHPTIFVFLDAVMRALRRDPRLFGGAQLVLCGDFHQLPPVPDDAERAAKREPPYVFETPLWAALRLETHYLRHSFRQQTSPALFRLLQAMRGERAFTAADDALLAECRRPFADRGHPDAAPIMLATHHRIVDARNHQRFYELTTPVVTYACDDTVLVPRPGGYDAALSDFAPARVAIRRGQRVLLTANHMINDGVANGSLGTVVGFAVPTVETTRGRNGEPVSAPVPTVFVPRDVTTSRELAAGAEPCPVVQFDSGATLAVPPFSFAISDNDVDLATRTQCPLLPGWAITIHRSQGMSLACMHAAIGDLFAPGQMYVGMSRATSPDGLYITGDFDLRAQTPHEKVAAFMAAASAAAAQPRIDFAKRVRYDPAGQDDEPAPPARRPRIEEEERKEEEEEEEEE